MHSYVSTVITTAAFFLVVAGIVCVIVGGLLSLGTVSLDGGVAILIGAIALFIQSFEGEGDD